MWFNYWLLVYLITVEAGSNNFGTTEFFTIGNRKRLKASVPSLQNSVIKSKLSSFAEVFRNHVDNLIQIQNSKNVDLIFLVDASSSVGADNFESELQFIKKLLLRFSISHNHTRVAIITFASASNVVRVVDQISNSKENANMCEILSKQVFYSGGGTYTLGALQEAKAILSHSQQENHRAVFLITDGFSNGGDPRPVAKVLREQGVFIYTFGVQSGNTAELYNIASVPVEQYSYILNSFQEFESLARRSLYSDMVESKYEPVRNATDCQDKCPEGGFCACGLTTGYYICICPPGHFLENNTCLPCPNGTFSESGVGLCIPCPDINQVTFLPATSIDHCICKQGFEPSLHICKPLQCAPLTPPKNGMFVKGKCSSVLNAGCGVRCNIGFTLEGSSVRLCQENATWSGTPPVCIVKKCKLPLPPKHGNVECNFDEDGSGLPVDSHCSFSCMPGFQLAGSHQRTCLPVAKWDGIPAKCKSIVCDKLPSPERGFLKPDECMTEKRHPFGRTCEVKCDSGYELQGPSFRNCTEQGTWTENEEYSVCLDVTPPTLKCPENIQVLLKPGESLTNVTWEHPQVTDNSGDEVTIWTQPIINFPLMVGAGTHTILYVAMDSSFNQEICNFTVSVKEETLSLLEDCESNEHIFLDKRTFKELQQNLSIFQMQTPAFEKFSVNENTLIMKGIDSEGKVCIINITAEDNACRHLEKEKLNGNIVCEEDNYRNNCILICREGFAIPYQNQLVTKLKVICDSGKPPEIPFCSELKEPDQVLETNTVNFPSTENITCHNEDFLNDLRNEITALCVDCSIENLTCKSDLAFSKNEENSNRIIRQVPHQKNVTIIQISFKRKRKEGDPKKPLLQKNFLKKYMLNVEEGIVRSDETKAICSPGSVSSGKYCMRCSPGWFYNKTSNNCSLCPDDEYQPHFGELGCIKCSKHPSVTIKKPATSPGHCKRLCPAGTYSVTGQVFPCLPCQPGSYMPNYGALHCKQCPQNTTTLGYNSKSVNNCIPDLAPCQVNPCKNNASCITKSQFSMCVCPNGFIGSHCERALNPCSRLPCINGGKCFSLTSPKTYYCDCRPEFRGINCQLDVNECTANPCKEGGTCINTMGGFKCLCPPKFQGELCEQVVNLCEEHPCMEGSTCVMDGNDYKCVCPNGWHGKFCEIDPCYNISCLHGTCKMSNGTFLCHCYDGFYGEACDLKETPCKDNPCQNGGLCIVKNKTSYLCLCNNNFFGENCTQNSTYFSLSFPSFGATNYAEIFSNWTSLEQVSVCFWVKVKGTSNYGTILSYATKQEANTFTVVDFNGFVLYVNGEYIVTDTIISDGEWHSACILWSSNGNYSIYVEGSLYESGEGLAVNTTIQGFGTIIIGQEQDTFGSGFNALESFVGELSQLNIWDHWLDISDIREFAYNCHKAKMGNILAWPEVLNSLHGNIKVLEPSLCKGCAEPPSSLHSNVQHISERYEAIYSCDEGYEMAKKFRKERSSTSKSTYCLKHGKWETPIPKCKPVSCHFPGYLPNGNMWGYSYVYPHKIYYNCSEPYKLHGSSIRQCLSNGSWSGLRPSCQVGPCPQIPDFPHGTVWFNNNTANFECKSGYTLKGENILSCQNNKWNHDVPVCKKKGCELLNFKNIIITRNDSTVEVWCDSGYELHVKERSVSKLLLKCVDKDGEWNWRNDNVGDVKEKDWECKAKKVQCGKPEPLENGTIKETEGVIFDVGTKLFVDCKQGYTFQDNRNFTECLANGSWSHINSSICRKVSCGQPEKIELADLVILSGVEFNNIVLIQCNEGYQGFGNMAIKCQANEKWSRFKGKCIRRSCGKPQILGGGKISGTSYLFMDRVTVTCPKGKNLVGEETLICGKNGTWSSTPQCV